MPINPGDLAECRLGSATGEEQQTPPFVLGQDGVGTVLKACCRVHVNERECAGKSLVICSDVLGKVTTACEKPQIKALLRSMFPGSIASLTMSTTCIAQKHSLGCETGVTAGGRGRGAGGGRPGGAPARQHGHLAHAGGLEGARPAAPAARRAAGARPSWDGSKGSFRVLKHAGGLEGATCAAPAA